MFVINLFLFFTDPVVPILPAVTFLYTPPSNKMDSLLQTVIFCALEIFKPNILKHILCRFPHCK